MTMDLTYPMKKKSHLIDQQKLKVLCDHLCDNIDDILQYLNLEYRQNPKFISMCCPIHGGDNDSAINLYYTGDSYRGNWKCRTHQCEKHFKGSIIGFIRGVLSHQKHNWNKPGDDTVSFKETIQFITDFTKINVKDIKISNKQKEKNNFVNSLSILTTKQQTHTNSLTRKHIRKLLKIPSQYFVSRGFDPDILDKYDVGDCCSENKEMSNRAVVPIYDTDYQHMIGCSGRSTNNEIKPKWKHSKGFSAENCLYNFWFAKDNIKKSKTVIIVESPGNVWKLESYGIHNSVAIFGSNLNDKQKMLLDTSGAMKLVIITDSDDAGEKARNQIEDKCKKIYNIEHIRLSKNDIAELSHEEMMAEIVSKLGGV